MSAPTLERGPAPAGTRVGAVAHREARLRSEFAALYPGLRAGEWAPAAVVADRVLAVTAVLVPDLPDAKAFRVTGPVDPSRPDEPAGELVHLVPHAEPYRRRDGFVTRARHCR